MKEITISEKKFKGIVNQAFRKGESWGCTYQGWFTPTKEDTEKRRKEALDRAYEIVQDKNDNTL